MNKRWECKGCGETITIDVQGKETISYCEKCMLSTDGRKVQRI